MWSSGGDSESFYDGLRETRERCKVVRGISEEEALLFEGKTKERVEIYKRMLDEMWTEIERLMD